MNKIEIVFYYPFVSRKNTLLLYINKKLFFIIIKKVNLKKERIYFTQCVKYKLIDFLLNISLRIYLNF